MIAGWTDIVWIALFAVFLACCAWAVWMQAVVLLRIVKPFEREDDRGPFLFRVPGKAKRARLRAFLGAAEHRGLRRRWGTALLGAFGSGLVLAIWTGVFGGMALP